MCWPLATLSRRGDTARATLINRSPVPAVMVKLTVLGPDGRRLLPVYLSDNYVSLLPGERRDVTIRCNESCPLLTPSVRGWNVPSNDGEAQN